MGKKNEKEPESSIILRGVALMEGKDFKQEGFKLYPVSKLAKKVFKNAKTKGGESYSSNSGS